AAFLWSRCYDRARQRIARAAVPWRRRFSTKYRAKESCARFPPAKDSSAIGRCVSRYRLVTFLFAGGNCGWSRRCSSLGALQDGVMVTRAATSGKGKFVPQTRTTVPYNHGSRTVWIWPARFEYLYVVKV